MSNFQVVNLERLLSILFDSSTWEDLSRRMVHEAGVLPAMPVGVHFLFISPTSELRYAGGYGPLALKDGQIGSIWGDSPLATATRNGEIDLLKSDSESGGKKLVLVPLLRQKLPVGLLVIEYMESEILDLGSESLNLLALLGGYLPEWREAKVKKALAVNTAQVANQELTTRQKDILRLIGDGLTNAQIAQIVLISESTVRQETIRIYRLLGVPNRHEAMLKARALGIIS